MALTKKLLIGEGEIIGERKPNIRGPHGKILQETELSSLSQNSDVIRWDAVCDGDVQLVTSLHTRIAQINRHGSRARIVASGCLDFGAKGKLMKLRNRMSVPYNCLRKPPDHPVAQRHPQC